MPGNSPSTPAPRLRPVLVIAIVAVVITVGIVVGLVVGSSNSTSPPHTTSSGATKSEMTAHGPLRPASTNGISGWHRVGSYDVTSWMDGEGMATVTEPGGKRTIIYRGDGSITAAMTAQGWTHIGDPASLHGVIIDAYQGSASGGKKMYLATTPTGSKFEYVHHLARGELYNNSFVVLDPDGKWMVSGTWTTQRSLQIFPAPYLNPVTPRRGGALAEVGSIDLSHPDYDVQGCDFVTANELVCAATGDSRDFTNPKPLFEVKLASSLNGKSVKGDVIDLGSIPEHSTCSGTFEAEGVDFDPKSGILRVEMIEPGDCIIHTTVYEYRRNK